MTHVWDGGSNVLPHRDRPSRIEERSTAVWELVREQHRARCVVTSTQAGCVARVQIDGQVFVSCRAQLANDLLTVTDRWRSRLIEAGWCGEIRLRPKPDRRKSRYSAA